MKRKQDMTKSERLAHDDKLNARRIRQNAQTKDNRAGNARIITRNIDTINKSTFKEIA